MKAYATKYQIFDKQNGFYEFEVLNELKDLSNRKDSNVLTHTRFLFEFDDRSIEEQTKVILDAKKQINIRRVVFSGSKSLHTIVELDRDFGAENYKKIWQYLENKYFKDADSACANPARLTRAPNILRQDKNCLQSLLFEGEIATLDYDDVERYLEKIRDYEAIQKLVVDAHLKNQFKSNADVCTRNFNTVKRYLETPFLKQSGNGFSSKWLYSAIQTCKQFCDVETLNLVTMKARNEGWSASDINNKMR